MRELGAAAPPAGPPPSFPSVSLWPSAGTSPSCLRQELDGKGPRGAAGKPSEKAQRSVVRGGQGAPATPPRGRC
ncbi:MAG: hypothetical protein BJ554DRAFT_1761 [Olpidium bornovanus]|uniref:Uncharacterized protein n=1 Tax=Olpidium bornovanus TaxID=278681 RepID=A0A8H8DHG5_9FUNG|nr:MAG: hypothetical protein BJ554DRAFT_1761 [Olpidium bornovanus]